MRWAIGIPLALTFTAAFGLAYLLHVIAETLEDSEKFWELFSESDDDV